METDTWQIWIQEVAALGQLTPNCSWWHDEDDDDGDDDNDQHHDYNDCDHNNAMTTANNDYSYIQEGLTMYMCASGWVRVQKWATAYSISAPKIKLKQIPK